MIIGNVDLGGGQRAVTFSASGLSFANCRYPILAPHGHGGLAINGYALQNSGGHFDALVDAGHVVIVPDAGGAASWGGPAAMTAMDAAYAVTGRADVGLCPYSMGNAVGLNWLKRNPEKVRAYWGWAPVTDLDWAYQNGTWAPEIDTAFGTPYATTTVGYRIHDEPASFRGVCPIALAIAVDDAVVVPANVSSFVASVNDPLVTYRPIASGNHTGLFTQVPTSEVVRHFDVAA